MKKKCRVITWGLIVFVARLNAAEPTNMPTRHGGPIVLEQETIAGAVQKPEAQFFLQRARFEFVDFYATQNKQQLLQGIVDVVNSDLF